MGVLPPKKWVKKLEILENVEMGILRLCDGVYGVVLRRPPPNLV